MCVVSAVIDSGRGPWEDTFRPFLPDHPWKSPSNPWDSWPNTSPVTPPKTIEYIPPSKPPEDILKEWDVFKEIIRRLDEMDKKLNQVACDETKREWIYLIDQRLKALEAVK
jgi:hypothetical protein